MDKRHIVKRPAFWLVAVAVATMAVAVPLLLDNQITPQILSPLREGAVYRNGLYFVTSEVENEEAAASLQNDINLYDGKVTGAIEVKEHTEFEWDDMPDGIDIKDAYLNDLQYKYVFTWANGTDEHQMDTFNKSYWGCAYDGNVYNQVMYGLEVDESIQARDEDILIRIYITSFDQPLQFIIPAVGTAPEHGILYGTFSPSDIIYLSPDISDDPASFLNAAKNVVFEVYDDVFAVRNPTDNDVIQEATYKLRPSNGYVLDDIIYLYSPSDGMSVPEVDISGYTSKMLYWASGLGENNDYCAVLLMDDETWIGYWNWNDEYSKLRCDCIFRVENVD